MESFHWDQHFVTGLSEVDHQHHHLVDIINKFSHHLAENELAINDIEGIFKELSDYAEYHFQEEERMMSKIGIDQRHLASHIEGHHNFLQEVQSLHKCITPDNPASAKYLLEFLNQWLAYHILGTDQKMARQIKSIQSGASSIEAYDEEEHSNDSATAPLLVALNGLFQQVSKRNRELLQLNQHLEKKVAERTKALSAANLHFEELALTDVLTGLPNRRHAMRQLIILWDESLTTNNPLVCMMIDADHFKEINDTFGHDAGDTVLRELAKMLQHIVRTDDIVCRLGGDEFLVICPDTDQRGGMYIAEQIRKRVSELRVPMSDKFWYGSISIGVAARSSDMESHEDQIKLADKGVYAAKRAGKNCVRTIT